MIFLTLNIEFIRVIELGDEVAPVFLSRCLLYSPVTDSDQATVPTHQQLSAVFQKGLVMNVFRDGVFGSFRHIPLMSGTVA